MTIPMDDPERIERQAEKDRERLRLNNYRPSPAIEPYLAQMRELVRERDEAMVLAATYLRQLRETENERVRLWLEVNGYPHATGYRSAASYLVGESGPEYITHSSGRAIDPGNARLVVDLNGV